LVVVGHFSILRFARHCDRSLVAALHKSDGISGMRNYDVRPVDMIEQFVESDEWKRRAGKLNMGNSALNHDMMPYAQRADNRKKSVKRPGAHPNRDKDFHQYSSPMKIALECTFNIDRR
jgi:hypothetical protein